VQSQDAILRRVEHAANKAGDQASVVAQVVEAARSELGASFKHLDEAVQGVRTTTYICIPIYLVSIHL